MSAESQSALGGLRTAGSTRSADDLRHLAVVTPMPPEQIARSYRILAEALPDHAMFLLGVDGRIMTWNVGAEAIKGYRAQEIVGQHFSIFYTPEAVAVGHPDRELELASLTGRYEEDGWRVRKDGSRFWAHVQILALRDDDGDLMAFGKLTTDLTFLRQRDEQVANVLAVLEQTMRLDHLTGLPNRRAWDERLLENMDQARGALTPFVVALLDLDKFKLFNDEFGHLAGDRLLKRVSLAWRGCLRPGDLLARYGGEEFIIALPNCPMEEAQGVLARLLAAVPDQQTVSAGLSLWDGLETADALVSRTDRALYQAKADGRNRIQVSAG